MRTVASTVHHTGGEQSVWWVASLLWSSGTLRATRTFIAGTSISIGSVK